MSKPRPLYAYRLVVEYPDGIDWTNPPKLWQEDRDEGGIDPDLTFSWPARRHYLSMSGARKRADLLRRYGCVVGIQRSDRITWVEP